MKERIAQIQDEVQMLKEKPLLDYQAVLTKLITAEKLLRQVVNPNNQDTDIFLIRFYNAYLLLSTY